MQYLSFSLYMADPIHHLIGITEIERNIIDSPAFQRLRKIKQLGNVHLLFPGAIHTRYSHSLGVMHTASQIFESLMKKSLQIHLNQDFHDAVSRVHQLIRLAGLLHDIGHGPLSHHFEECLKTHDKVHKKFVGQTYSSWSGDLKISREWVIEKRWESFSKQNLDHEHFSFGVIKHLGDKFGIDSQGICSLLSDEIKTSPKFEKDLEIIAKAFSKQSVFTESLKKCLKSILSGQFDADRLDYLRRDSYYCGTSIAAIDLHHLLASITLDYDKGEFFIKISRNAIPVVENILISRKQMFNQIYNHRINACFDFFLSKVIDWFIIDGTIETPRNFHEFIGLTDEYLEKNVSDLVDDITLPPEKSFTALSTDAEFNQIARICAKFFATRSPFVRLHEEDVAMAEADSKMDQLSKQFSANHPNHIAMKIDLKKFYKASDQGEKLMRISSPNEDSASTTFAETSEVIKSNVWQDDRCRVVICRSFAESATKRSLETKLKDFVLIRESINRKAQALKK